MKISDDQPRASLKYNIYCHCIVDTCPRDHYSTLHQSHVSTCPRAGAPTLSPSTRSRPGPLQPTAYGLQQRQKLFSINMTPVVITNTTCATPLLLSMTATLTQKPVTEMGFNVLVECSQYLISASYRVADNGAGDEELSL